MIREFQIDEANPKAACEELVSSWKNSNAKVFVLRGSVEGAEKVKEYYESLFPSLGAPVALAEDVTVGGRDNQRTGKIWMEVRYDPKFPDAYRHSANAQPLHTDGSYIPSFPNATLLACVNNAAEGGETTFIDSNEVVAALETENPELLKFLTTQKVLHERSGDQRDSYVIYKKNGEWHLNWNYYCVSEKIDPSVKTRVDEFFNFLQNSQRIKDAIIPVKLTPGDAVTWKDEEVLHGRHSFKANQVSERYIWKCAIDIGKIQTVV